MKPASLRKQRSFLTCVKVTEIVIHRGGVTRIDSCTLCTGCPCDGKVGSLPASHHGGPGRRPVHVELLVDAVAMGQVFSEYVGFPVTIFSYSYLINSSGIAQAV